MDLAAAIKYQMRRCDLPQCKLCERIGISRSYLYKLLNGMHIPSIEMVEKIAKGLYLRPCELLFLAEEIDETHELDEQLCS